MSTQIQLLKSKRFLPLFITQFFGAFNDNAFKNAFLIWFSYDVISYHNLNVATMLTLAAGLFILPFFLFSATAGQITDKYEKSWLTQKIKQVEIVLMIACAFCFFSKSVIGLLVVLFFMGVQSSFFGPVKYSLLPEHLADDELISGNGLIEGATFLAILLGTIFGALVIRSQYGVAILSICVIAFAVIGWVSSCFIPKARIGDPQLKINYHIFLETWKIIGYAKKERTVWLSILGISWFWLIGATFLTQFPTYTKEIVHGDEHIVTLFMTIFSVGIGIGSVFCNKLLKGKIDGRLVPYGSVGISIAILLFVVSSHFYQTEFLIYSKQSLKPSDALLTLGLFFQIGVSSWGIMLSLLILSLFSGVYIVPLYAMMQHRSPSRYLARIVAANNVMNALFMVIASLGALVLFLIHFTVINLFLTIGILNILVFLVVNRVVKRRIADV